MKARELTAVEYYSQISISELLRVLGYKSRATIWQKVKSGELPEPRYLDDHAPRWRLGEVIEVLEKQAKMKDKKRGLRGSPEVDVFSPKKPTQKGRSVWDRLRLQRPK